MATLVIGREGSNESTRRSASAIRIIPHTPPEQPGMDQKVTRINTPHIELFAYLLQKLKSTADGDGTLLTTPCSFMAAA